jgi:hypothetical protein
MGSGLSEASRSTVTPLESKSSLRAVSAASIESRTAGTNCCRLAVFEPSGAARPAKPPAAGLSATESAATLRCASLVDLSQS